MISKNTFAFTLVELLVVSTIIVVLSVSSIFYFFDFTDKRELIIYTDILEDTIEDLDRQVKDFVLSDYRLEFIPEQNYYFGEQNSLGVESPMQMSFDPLTYEATVSIPGGLSSQAWTYIIYSQDKKLEQKIISADSTLQYQFRSGVDYEIQGYLDNISLNTLSFHTLPGSISGLELIDVGSGVFLNQNNHKPYPLNLIFQKADQQHTLILDI